MMEKAEGESSPLFSWDDLMGGFRGGLDLGDAIGEPVGFGFEAIGGAEVVHLGIALEDVEADVPLELLETDRAKEERLAVGFGEGIGAIHVAGIGGAVGDPEHVAGLVGHDLTCASEEKDVGFGGAREVPELRGVADKGIDADAFGEAGLAENVVPGFFGIEVGHGDAEVSEGVFGKAGCEDFIEKVGGEVLGLVGERIYARGGLFGGKRKLLLGADFELEEDAGELGGLVEEVFAILIEGTERLDDQDGARLDGTQGFGSNILFEGLSGFFVHGEPVGGTRGGKLGKVGIVGGGEGEGAPRGGVGGGSGVCEGQEECEKKEDSGKKEMAGRHE